MRACGPWPALAQQAPPHDPLQDLPDDALHVHLVLNHLPIYGTLMGLIALALALLWKSEGGRRIALILLLLCTAGAYFVFQSGQQAYEGGRIIADDPGQHWIDEHLSRAEKGIYVFYAAALLCLGGLFAGWRKSRWAVPLAIAASLASLAALGAAVWIADAGGKIRHREIRESHAGRGG